MKLPSLKDAIYIAAALAGIYVAWRTFGAVGAVGGALTATGEKIGSGLYDWLHPNEWDSYRFSTSSGHAVLTQVVNRSTGEIWNVKGGKFISRAGYR